MNTDPQRAARREAPRAQLAADHAGAARRGLLHEGRHDAIRTRCTSSAPTWTARLGRGRERRRLRHGARDGARARLQQPGRADRALDPLRPLEQRGDRAQRRARLRRAAPGAAGQGRPGRIGQVSRAEVARHDPARHDDVRPRHAATPTARSARSSGPRPTSTSSSRSNSKMAAAGAEAGVGRSTPRTRSTRPTTRPRSART